MCEYRSPTHVYKGVVNTMPVSIDSIKKIENELELDKSDLVLALYPKAGMHWVAEIVHALAEGPEATLSRTECLENTVPFIEFGSFKENTPSWYDVITGNPPPRIFATHLYSSYYERFLHDSANCPRFICVFRNPKDILVGFYHFHRLIGPWGFEDVSWNDFFDTFKRKALNFGDVFDHNTSWYKFKDHSNVLVIHYEDMLADATAAVNQMAKFMGKSYDDKQIADIVHNTSFNQMKARPPKVYTDAHAMFDEKSSPFQRKGIKGDWRNYFTEEQSAYVDDLIKQRCQPIGLNYTF